MDLHSLLLSFSYVGIFILMISNGVINLPSSQLLYLITGYFVSTGNLLLIPAIIIGSLGNTIGNIISYELVKRYDKPLARKLLMMNEETFGKVHQAFHGTFQASGMWWIFLGKLTPSVKAFIPIVSGLAHTPRRLTYFIFLSASFIWASLLITLGYYFGEKVSLKSFTAISLIIGLTILFVVYKQLKKKGLF
ncbi:MAG: putative rane protein [Candidatus Nomurabacteria bacterium]|nr:putative rane protein [Candidatus Nomurabacteria bacterium]